MSGIGGYGHDRQELEAENESCREARNIDMQIRNLVIQVKKPKQNMSRLEREKTVNKAQD